VAFLALLGAALVALAAYSAGAVLAARGRGTVPGLLDLALALACAAGACVLVARMGRLPGLGSGVAVSLALGAATEPLRARADRGRIPAHGRPAEGGAWKRFSRRMGNFQGRMMLGLLYFVLVAPFALVARLRSDPLSAGRAEGGSLWRERSPDDGGGLAAARRQS
jgi:hypothetical protein